MYIYIYIYIDIFMDVYRLFESLIVDNGLSWEVVLEGGGTTMDDPPPVTGPIR